MRTAGEQSCQACQLPSCIALSSAAARIIIPVASPRCRGVGDADERWFLCCPSRKVPPASGQPPPEWVAEIGASSLWIELPGVAGQLPRSPRASWAAISPAQLPSYPLRSW
jgi:hypothetical protein